MTEAKKSRADLRSRILGEKVRKEIITLPNGDKVEVHEPSVSQMLRTVAIEDTRTRMLRMLVDSCFVPGTNEKVFEDADIDALGELPFGGSYNALIDKVQSFMDISKKVEEEGKVTEGAPANS